MELRLKKHMSKIQEADLVLVFSCGVGVQTVSEYLEDKDVYKRQEKDRRTEPSVKYDTESDCRSAGIAVTVYG